MPKATLSFNLPEEQSEYQTTANAGKYQGVIWDYIQYLRQCIKYDDISSFKTVEPSDYVPKEESAAFQEKLQGSDDVIQHVLERVRTKLFELINEEGVGDDF